MHPTRLAALTLLCLAAALPGPADAQGTASPAAPAASAAAPSSTATGTGSSAAAAGAASAPAASAEAPGTAATHLPTHRVRRPVVRAHRAPVRHAAASPVPAGVGPGRAVVLAQRPLTREDAVARQLTAPDLRASDGQGETPLVLVGTAQLGAGRQDAALFVQLQSADLCGSAGCSTSVYLHQGGEWRKVLDSISGPIRVDSRRHSGMADLVVGDNDRWVWNGSAYADTVAAPPIVDLRKSVAEHRAALAREK